MRALLLPVKDLRQAKQRLAPFLNAEERLGLAQAMLADTIHAVCGVRQAEKIFVVTNYVPAMEAAEQNGWDLLREDRQISESFSVDYASMLCARRGVSALMRLPLDVPLVQSSDIDELLAVECAAQALVIVPSRDGTGTNAILRTPPTLFPSHFGSRSFAKHCAEAKRAGAEILIRRNARLEMDVDDVADLRALASEDLRGTETGAWLECSGLLQRLMQPVTSGKPQNETARF